MSLEKGFNPNEKRQARNEIPKQLKTMEEEASLNSDQYQKYKGTPVMYGQQIQLMHVNSNKFLAFDLNNVSDYQSDNLRVYLRDEYSDETTF